jgi:uncharacterized cupredoxin-like copper-binding protein
VLDIFRGSDGMLQVNWRYRNPTDQRAHVMSSDQARDLMEEVYVVDPAQKKKYSVAAVEPEKGKKPNREDRLAAQISETDLEPGASMILWAKFLAPAEGTKEISLYLPNSPPLEDLAIQKRERAQVAAASEGVPLAKEAHQSGAEIQVTRVRRSSDGTVEVRWRYANTGKSQISVLKSDDARDLAHDTYVMDPDAKTKYPVATDDRKQPLAAKVSSTQLGPGKSQDVWMKFAVPASAKRISLFLPGSLPVEDLPIAERK